MWLSALSIFFVIVLHVRVFRTIPRKGVRKLVTHGVAYTTRVRMHTNKCRHTTCMGWSYSFFIVSLNHSVHVYMSGKVSSACAA